MNGKYSLTCRSGITKHKISTWCFLAAIFAFSSPAVSLADDLRTLLGAELNTQVRAFSNVVVHYSLIEDYGKLSESGVDIAGKIFNEARAKGREVSMEYLETLSRRDAIIDNHVFVYAGSAIYNKYGTYTTIQRVAGSVEKDVADLDGNGLRILHHLAIKSFPFLRYIQIDDRATRVLFTMSDRELRDNRATVYAGNESKYTWARDPAYMYMTRLQDAIYRATSLEVVEANDYCKMRMSYDSGSVVVLNCLTNGPIRVQMSSSYDSENRLLSKTEYDQYATNANTYFPHKIIETKYNRYSGDVKLRTIIQVDSIMSDQNLATYAFTASTSGIHRIRDLQLIERPGEGEVIP